MTTPTLAESLTAATDAVAANAQAFFTLEDRVAKREAAAVQAAGGTPSATDTTELARAMARGLFVGSFGASPNALSCQIPGGLVLPALESWTRLRGIAQQTNTSANVTFTVAGVGGAPASLVTGNLYRQDGSALAIGDIPVGRPFEVQPDAASPGNFRLVGPAVSDTLATIAANLVGIQNPLPAVTTPGTYTYTPSSPKVRAILVRLQAGGGGSGGSLNCTSSQVSVGVAGGGGGYVEHYIPIANAAAYTAPYVVGAGGAAGTSTGSSATAGGTGGTSSFGGGPTAFGGVGGAAGVNVPTTVISNTAGAAGGSAAGGNIVNIPGGGAQSSQYLQGAPYGGLAGPSQLGKSALPFATTSPGAIGSGFGAGATPGVTQANGVGQQGAVGGSGLVQITEIF